MLPVTILSALAMAVGALGSPINQILQERGILKHDAQALQPIRTRLQGGDVGRAIQIFTPLLHIAHGCQPYTAVNDEGYTR